VTCEAKLVNVRQSWSKDASLGSINCFKQNAVLNCRLESNGDLGIKEKNLVKSLQLEQMTQ